MISLVHKVAVTGALGAMLMAAGAAQAALPPTHTSGSVEYMTGGIGKDESSAIQRASRDWPLTLEFAARDRQASDFLADVRIQVRDGKGKTVLEATADGPFLLAKLPPGPYNVDATFADKTLHRKVVIGPHQPASALFVWQADTSKNGA